MARAAVLHAVGDDKLDLRDDVTTAAPGPAEVKVRVKATGICHSDLSVMTGALPQPLPVVLGHEGAGEVIEVGDQVASVQPGDHVVLCWIHPCEECRHCLSGRPTLCMVSTMRSFAESKFTYGGESPAFGMSALGTWADEVTVPWQGAIRVDRDIPLEVAALIGCGVPTGVGAALNTAKVKAGSSVAVIGCGGVGLSVIQGARLSGASTILAVDPLESKHALAKKVGATHTCTPDQLTDAISEITGGDGFDYGFEVVGLSQTIMSAWQATRRGGDVIIVGAGRMDDAVPFNAFQLLFEGKNILSSLYGDVNPRRDFPLFASLWKAGKLDLESLISRRVRFPEINDAIEALKGGEVLRQVILP